MDRFIIILFLFISCASPQAVCDFKAEIQAGSICNIYTIDDSISQNVIYYNAPDLQSSLDTFLMDNDLSAIGVVSFDTLSRTYTIEIINTILSFDAVRWSNSPGCTWPEYTAFDKTCLE